METFKTCARDRFKLMIYESDGQAFENIFHRIMGYHDGGYQAVKSYGNQGDLKNDGYNPTSRLFYQVYAPEKIDVKKVNGKLEKDFLGLNDKWNDIQKYHFVINDKYKGIPAPCHQKMEELTSQFNIPGIFVIAKDLENTFLSLTIDQIQSIIGYVLVLTPGDRPHYNILAEVINHLNQQNLSLSSRKDYQYPDWDKKLVFNHISNDLSNYLSQANHQVHDLNRYLDAQGDALRENLFNIVKNCYVKLKRESHTHGDNLFREMVNQLSPVKKRPYQHAVIVILSKYFESCDIFERPVI